MKMLSATILASCWFLAGHTNALQLPSIHVIDVEGKSVANAVVNIAGAQAEPTTDHSTNKGGLNTTESGNKNLAIMDQKDLQFQPRVLVIKPGTWVHFPNSDDTRHHVYSFSEAKTFELPLYSANDADPVYFDQAGIVALGCNIHDHMRGYIVVSADTVIAVSDKQGMAFLPPFTHGEVDGEYLNIWHPQLPSPFSVAVDSVLENSSDGIYTVRLEITSEYEQEQLKSTLKSRLKRYNRGI